MVKEGKLTQNGVHLENHEYRTVKLFLEHGFDVELIPPLRIEAVRTADIVIQGVVWEMKAPTGNGKNVIRHTVQRASHQSNNIIIDLRRCRLDEERAITELKQHFKLSKRIRRMKIVTKDEEILDFSK